MEARLAAAHAGGPSVRLPAAGERVLAAWVGGYWVTGEPVEAIEQVIINDLVSSSAS